MWNLKQTVFMRLCLVTLLYFSMVDCRLLPTTRQRPIERKGKPMLPQDFLERGKAMLAGVKIPNREFCSEMILQPEDQYLVLPWWYHYCQDLHDKNAKNYNGNVHYTAIHKYILEELQAYKKKQRQKKKKLIELEKELGRNL